MLIFQANKYLLLFRLQTQITSPLQMRNFFHKTFETFFFSDNPKRTKSKLNR